MTDYTEVVRQVFMCTRYQDYKIDWGTKVWKTRNDKVPSELADVLGTLGLYWKFARNTAMSPWSAISVGGGMLREVIADNKLIQHKKRQKWKQLLGASEQQLFLIGSQTLAYSGFYFGYEHFITECCAISLDQDSSKFFGAKKTGKALLKIFDEDVESEIWSGDKVDTARKVRNALAHNGGKPDQELLDLIEKQGLDTPEGLLVDGYICIHPQIIKDLFETLSDNVDLILRKWRKVVA